MHQPRNVHRLLGIAFASLLTLTAAACGGATTTELGGPSGVRCSAAISAPSGGIGSSGGNLNITVGAARDCTWSAAAEASWLSVTPTGGQGEGVVRVTVAPNPQPSARTGRVVVDGTAVTITQAAAACSLTLDRTSASVPAAGGRVTIQVTGGSGCGWQASSNAPWIQLSTTAGSGAGTVHLDVAANTGAARSGTVVIAGTTVAVAQVASAAPAPPADPPGTPGGPPPPDSGGPGTPGGGTPPPNPTPPPCTYTLSPASHAAPASGGDSSFLVVTDPHCDWSATSSAAWISFRSSTTGRGPGEVRYRVADNTTSQARSATITVAGRTHVVSQAAGRPQRVEVEGRISSLAGTCPDTTFRIGRWTIVTDARTRWDDGRCTDLRNGVEVEVDGEVIDHNRLWAREVEFD